jgi:hypothetical protein
MYYLINAENVLVAKYSVCPEGLPLVEINGNEAVVLGADKFIGGQLIKASEAEKALQRERAKEIDPETEKADLRYRREVECYPIINRGQLWYNTLSEYQKQELNHWYALWLNVTATKVIPAKPDFIK